MNEAVIALGKKGPQKFPGDTKLIGAFAKGQRVRVYPRWLAQQSDVGDVLLISGAPTSAR